MGDDEVPREEQFVSSSTLEPNPSAQILVEKEIK